MQLDKNNLILDYYATKDSVIREKIVLNYQPLVEYVVRKLAYNKSDIQDLIQVGTIGLIKSIDRFNPELQIDFSTFATPNIIGEIKHYFRDKNHLVKVPRRLIELQSKIRRYVREYTQEYNRSPSISGIATHLNVTEEQVLESLEASYSSQVISLDSPTFNDNTSKDGQPSPTLIETVGTDTKENFLLEKESLSTALSELNEREREIIYLRYYKCLTQVEIAKKLNLSQMHISRLLSYSIKRLKKTLESAK